MDWCRLAIDRKNWDTLSLNLSLNLGLGNLKNHIIRNSVISFCNKHFGNVLAEEGYIGNFVNELSKIDNFISLDYDIINFVPIKSKTNIELIFANIIFNMDNQQKYTNRQYPMSLKPCL